MAVTFYWRALLFVPADRSQLVAKAVRTSADAVVLDLEDAVAPEVKPMARAALASACAKLREAGLGVVVRINRPWRLVLDDLQAATAAGADAIMVPKVEDAGHLRVIGEMLGEFEAAQQQPQGTVMLLALIESPVALNRLNDICAVDRVCGLALGSEDFSLIQGVTPSVACLELPCKLLALAAAPRGQMALGLPISIGEYSDLEQYRQAADNARAFGMSGALCIHPAQLRVIVSAFQPDGTERAEAEAILASWDSPDRKGRAVITVNGRMVDLPVVLRARRIVAVSPANVKKKPR